MRKQSLFPFSRTSRLHMNTDQRTYSKTIVTQYGKIAFLQVREYLRESDKSLQAIGGKEHKT